MLQELILVSPGIQAGRKTLIERDFGKTGTSIRCRRILPYSNIEAEFARSRYTNIDYPPSLSLAESLYIILLGRERNFDGSLICILLGKYIQQNTRFWYSIEEENYLISIKFRNSVKYLSSRVYINYIGMLNGTIKIVLLLTRAKK